MGPQKLAKNTCSDDKMLARRRILNRLVSAQKCNFTSVAPVYRRQFRRFADTGQVFAKRGLGTHGDAAESSVEKKEVVTEEEPSKTVSSSLHHAMISSFLRSKGMQPVFGHTCIMSVTPFEIMDESRRVMPMRVPNTSGVLYITKNSGHFACSDSGLTGNWEDLERHLKEFYLTPNEEVEPVTITKDQLQGRRLNSVSKLTREYTSYKLYSKFSEIEKQRIAARFGFHEVVSNSMIRRYGVRVSEDMTELVFPYYTDSGDFQQAANKVLMGYRRHSINADGSLQITTHSVYDDNFVGLFGLHMARKNNAPLIVTSNELDALVIASTTNYQAVALPFDPLYFKARVTEMPIHPFLVPYFERFHEIHLWLSVFSSSDMPKIKNFQQFIGANVLSTDRVNVVDYSDTNTKTLAPRYAGLEATNIIKTFSRSLSKQRHDASSDRFVRYVDLQLTIQDEVENGEKYHGHKHPHHCFGELQQIMGGMRPGELTVFTGPTGAGKTTFIAQYALLMAMYSNVTTLFGSFEVKPERLISRTLIPQFEGMLKSSKSRGEAGITDFADVPIYYTPYTRTENPVQFINMLMRAKHETHMEHVIIDNLQYIMGAAGAERFDLQDRFVVELRKFASENNVHVSLVCHPRKVNGDYPIHIDSLYGGVRLTQEADNVFILQKYKQGGVFQNYLEVVKNRYLGQLGTMKLKFDKKHRCYNMQQPDANADPRNSSMWTPPTGPTSESYTI